MWRDNSTLEHFLKKWMPIFRKKMRQNKKLERLTRALAQTKTALAFIPGILLCLGLAGLSYALQVSSQKFLTIFTPDALVLAILIGVILRTLASWQGNHLSRAPSQSHITIFGKRPNFAKFEAGIGFCGRFLLEVAVMLLGASISISILAKSGIMIMIMIVVLVVAAIGISYGIARLLHLPPRLALLIACGNSICGNSAIAAVACIIRAKSEEVTPAIAFTAVLGVIAVLLLPLIQPLLALSHHQYGVLVGLTVYAVPQVLAAALPVSVIAAHSATVVKLIRVLLLGPLIFVISLIQHNQNGEGGRVAISRLLPWFIIGFALLMGLRSADLIPIFLLEPLAQLAKFLTLMSMAALGLSVDIRSLVHAGGRVILAASLSLLTLACLATLVCLFFVA